MTLQQEMNQICDYIYLLTGVHCALLELRDGQPADFPGGCGECTTNALRSLNGGKMVNGQRQYGCSCGAVYIETVLNFADDGEICSLLAGPIQIKISGGCSQKNIPYMTEEGVEALKATIQSLCEHLIYKHLFACLKQTETSAGEQQEETCYPVEDERRLQQFIRAGERIQASQLLNALMLEMYRRDGNHLEQMKYRVWELITLMSRAALDGGADAEQLLHLCDGRRKQIGQMQTFDELDHCLAGTLHQFFEIVFESGGKKHQCVIRDISRYIEDHLSEKITLEDIAAHVHFSKSYLCRMIKEETGSTFTEYLNQLRVERSKSYLYRCELPISQIANLIGFEDQSYFTRIFKRYIGMPPGRYRMLNQGA